MASTLYRHYCRKFKIRKKHCFSSYCFCIRLHSETLEEIQRIQGKNGCKNYSEYLLLENVNYIKAMSDLIINEQDDHIILLKCPSI